MEWLKYNPIDARITDNIGFTTLEGKNNVAQWEREKYLKFDLPSKIGVAMSRIPIIGKPSMKQNADKWAKMGRYL